MKKILNEIFLDTTGIKLLFWIALSISIAYWQGIDPENYVFIAVMITCRFFTGYYLAAVLSRLLGDLLGSKKNGKREKKK